MVQALVSQSPDIQKVLAFESGFEKLFDIVTQEGGVDGGPVAQGALTCVDNLLRFNSSNQVLDNQFCYLLHAHGVPLELFPGNIYSTGPLVAPWVSCYSGSSSTSTPKVCSTVLGQTKASERVPGHWHYRNTLGFKGTLCKSLE